MYSFQTRKEKKRGWLIYLTGNNVIDPMISEEQKLRLIPMNANESVISHVHTLSQNGFDLSI